jgi:hypothetical protein
MMRRLFWLIPLVLSGCNSVDDPFLQTSALTRDTAKDAPALASSVSPEFALGSVPVIGSPATAVRQTARKNYAQQTIVYGNATDLPGENTLVVTVGAPGSDKGFTRAPSAGDIRAEIAVALPGVDMKISNVIGDNAYGTFGYASGTIGKGGSCIYAWQLARNVSARDGAGFAALGGSKYAAQVRLRYCAPSTSVEQLVGLMNGLRLKPVTAGTFDMLRGAAGQGFAATTSVPVLQPVVQQAAIATEPVIQRKRVRRTESPAVVEAVQEPVPDEASGIKNAVKIPLPGAAAVDADKQPVAAAAVAQDIPVEKAAQTQIAKPSLIPLPGAVAATE